MCVAQLSSCFLLSEFPPAAVKKDKRAAFTSSAGVYNLMYTHNSLLKIECTAVSAWTSSPSYAHIIIWQQTSMQAKHTLFLSAPLASHCFSLVPCHIKLQLLVEYVRVLVTLAQTLVFPLLDWWEETPTQGETLLLDSDNLCVPTNVCIIVKWEEFSPV